MNINIPNEYYNEVIFKLVQLRAYEKYEYNRDNDLLSNDFCNWIEAEQEILQEIKIK